MSDANASQLVISSSVYAPVEATERQLVALGQGLNNRVDVWVGGSPISGEIDGVKLVQSIGELAEMAALDVVAPDSEPPFPRQEGNTYFDVGGICS